jgi:hypothetical protein
VFNIKFLHVIREFEYKKIIEHFSAGARVLEIRCVKLSDLILL